MKKTMIAFAVLMSLTSFAHAGIENCDGSTQDMSECINRYYTKADAELNAQYAKTLAAAKAADANSEGVIGNSSGREFQNRLVNAQRAWIKFRDADCSLRGAEMLGGSGEGLILGGCKYEKTVDRTKELANIAKDISPR